MLSWIEKRILKPTGLASFANLVPMFDQLIFHYGSTAKIVGSNREDLKAVKAGYYQAIWEKNHA